MLMCIICDKHIICGLDSWKDEVKVEIPVIFYSYTLHPSNPLTVKGEVFRENETQT